MKADEKRPPRAPRKSDAEQEDEYRRWCRVISGGGAAAPIGTILDEGDHEALAREFDAFRRGLRAALRLLERETPLADGAIARLRALVAFVEGENCGNRPPMS